MKKEMYYLAAFEGIKSEAERIIRYDDTLMCYLSSVKKALMKERFKVEDEIYNLNDKQFKYWKREIPEVVGLGANKAIGIIESELKKAKRTDREKVELLIHKLEISKRNLIDKVITCA